MQNILCKWGQLLPQTPLLGSPFPSGWGWGLVGVGVKQKSGGLSVLAGQGEDISWLSSGERPLPWRPGRGSLCRKGHIEKQQNAAWVAGCAGVRVLQLRQEPEHY